MNQTELIDTLKKAKIIPVIVINDADKAVPLAKELLKNGITVAEVTFRTDAAQEAIRRIRKEVPEIFVGAGTVLTQKGLSCAIEAGAQFCVAPGLDPEIIKLAKENNMPFVPGVSTATEVTAALNLGCSFVKFFPAEAAGGIPMVKSLMAAFGHRGLSIMPTGGITETTADKWLQTPGVVCVGGSWMVSAILANV